MKADLSRDTFNPLNHFTRVLMQQGRAQLDADWNEQAAVLLRYLQALAVDLIGPHGGPKANYGFEIASLPVTLSATNDFRIGLGRYYVDGILCEAETTPVAIVFKSIQPAGSLVQVDSWTLDGDAFQANQYVELFDDVHPPASPMFSPTVVQIAHPDQAHLMLTLQGPPPALASATVPKIRRVITYQTQPDPPSPDRLGSGQQLVYLDVWERHITYVEDDHIREVALGGPDTATRAKLVWQVKVTRPPAGTKACLSVQQLTDRFQPENRGRLKATAYQGTACTDPLPPDARYRGAENRLYRVEVHRPGSVWDGTDNGKSTAATFKWSRENGSVVFPVVAPVVSRGETVLVTLAHLGRADRFGLTVGDWLELQDDDSVRQNEAGCLLQVQSIDRIATTVTLSGAPGPQIGSDLSLHPLLRRWDQKEGTPAEGGLQLGTDGAALIIEESNNPWLSLEDGVQIQFQPPDHGPATQYRTSDYWLIPARTATGDVEWPTEADAQGNQVPIPLPPHGVTHHYAPLALISVDASGAVRLTTDCRNKFACVVGVENSLQI